MFADKQLLRFAKRSMQQGLDLVLAGVIETRGSTYAKPGQVLAVNAKGRACGVLGSPGLHRQIIDLSHEVLQSRSVRQFESSPDDSSGHGQSRYLLHPFFHSEGYGALGEALTRFGQTWIRSVEDGHSRFSDEKISPRLANTEFYQTIARPYSLLIFGSGAHVTTLIVIANAMGWTTTVVDTKIQEAFVKEADHLIALKTAREVDSIDLTPYDAAVILSHSAQKDPLYLEALLSSEMTYIGMMGNKTNMRRMKERFNLTKDRRFFAPVGLDIGGKGAKSIALSICAQIEAGRNQKL